MLSAAAAIGQRSELNPARWKGHLERLQTKPPAMTRGHHAPPDTGAVGWMVSSACRGAASQAWQVYRYRIRLAGRGNRSGHA